MTLLCHYAAKVILDRETGRSRGFGFVTVNTPEDIDRAVSELHESVRLNILYAHLSWNIVNMAFIYFAFRCFQCRQ